LIIKAEQKPKIFFLENKGVAIFRKKTTKNSFFFHSFFLNFAVEKIS